MHGKLLEWQSGQARRGHSKCLRSKQIDERRESIVQGAKASGSRVDTADYRY
jgi:hypothetical protein